MRRWTLAVGVATVVIGALIFIRPYATREREVISSTPAAPSLFLPSVPVDLKPRDQLCVKDVPMDGDSQLVRVYVYTYGKPGARLGVEANGPGYRYRGSQPGGYPEGPVELSLRPPSKALDGNICMTNDGSRKVGIQATPVGQRFSRPQPYLNGGPLEQDVPMTIHARKPATLIQQVPRAIRHASVFVPLAPWALWVLLVLVLAGIPAAIFVALANAAVTAPADMPAPRRPAPSVPLARFGPPIRSAATRSRAWARRQPPVAWLAVVLLLVLAFAYLWASRMGAFQNDEAQNVYFARWMANHLPGSLWNFSQLERGLQRAEIYVLALTLGTLKSPGAFLVAHFINVAAWTSAGIPVYLLIRGLGVRAGWALLGALLAVTGPWLVFTVSFLTEPLAYPAFVWLLWATWRAVVEPRVSTQLTAVVILFIALLTRSAFLILLPLLPLAVLFQELRFRDFSGGARAVAARLWERHRVVVVMVAGGLAALVLSAAGVLPAPSRLTGAYGTPFSIIWGPFLDKTALYASRVVVGVGFVPFAIGLPWLVRQLIRPADKRTYAFVVTAVLMIVMVVYASSPAGPDERYVIYFGVPLTTAAVIAFARRDLGWIWVAIGGALGALLLYKHGWNPDGGPFGFFVGPAETFYARVGLLHLNDYVPPGITLQKMAFAIAIGVTAVTAYAFTRSRRARTVMVALVVGVALLQVAQAGYTTSKFVTQGGASNGPSHAQRAWVDEAIYGKSTAAIVGLGQGNTGLFDPIWAEIQFWNTSVTSEFALSPLMIQLPPGDYPGLITYDPKTGRAASKQHLPPYAVIPRGYVDLGLAGTPVAHAAYLAADLVRLAQPLHASFQISGPQPDGYIVATQPATIRFFSAGLDPAARWCGVVPLSAPVDPNGGKPLIRYTLGSTRGAVRGGSLVNARVPLDFGGRPAVGVKLVSHGRIELGDKRVVALQVGQISIAHC